MGESVYFRLSDLVNIVYLVSFIYSIIILKNNNIPKYIKGFYWYTIVTINIALVHISEKYFNLIPKDFFRILNLVSLIYHYTFLSLFISQFLILKKQRKYFKVLFIIFIIMLIAFIFTDIINHSVISFAIANLGLIMFCIFYYNQLFKNIPILNLLKEPSFWIITGIFFGMSITIPISLMGGYLYHNLSKNIYYSIATIMPFGYGMMHLFFIKAFLCSVQIHKEL